MGNGMASIANKVVISKMTPLAKRIKYMDTPVGSSARILIHVLENLNLISPETWRKTYRALNEWPK